MTTTDRTSSTTTALPGTARTYGHALRRLYLVRFVVAAVWVGVMFATSADATEPTALLTVLLVLYPLFDAGAVLWQLRADPDPRRSKAAERTNVVVSVVVAVALGIASSNTIPAALAVWGAWAIVAGVPQLIAAIRNRSTGGQVAQMLSGGISVVAGLGFLSQGLQDHGTISGTAGYAALGAIFFLVSALRLVATSRKQDS